MNKGTQFAVWREWWLSRLPEERESGFAVHLYKITPLVLVEVPVPFCGHVEVFIFSLGRTKSKTVRVGINAIGSLRKLFSSPRGGWKVERKPGRVQFWHGGVLYNHLGERIAGGF